MITLVKVRSAFLNKIIQKVDFFRRIFYYIDIRLSICVQNAVYQ
jgi:hypothetical protein